MSSGDRPAPGIRRLSNGRLQAYTKVGGRFRSKCFPADTALSELHRWRELQRLARWLPALQVEPGDPTFADDVRRYLSAVRGMASYRHREDDLTRWVRVLGGARPRASITSVEIRQQLEAWRREEYAASTLNHRRTALMHLWSVLDGRTAANPARDVPRYREVPEPLRLPSWLEAQRAVAGVHGAKTRARLTVMLWTGWPHVDISSLTETQVRAAIRAKRITLAGRKKGRGTRARTLPLLPQAVKALRAFHRADAYGSFSASSARTSLHRSCKAKGLTPFRPYDLRHLLLTTFAVITRDDRFVSQMARHADERQTRRYTEASVDPRLEAGLALVTQALKRRA